MASKRTTQSSTTPPAQASRGQGPPTRADKENRFLADLLAQHFAAQNCSAGAEGVADDAADGGAEGLVLGGKGDGGDLAAVAPFRQELKGEGGEGGK